MNTRSVENVAVVALLAVAAAACSGSVGDKAGGSAAQQKSLVLTLEQPDPTFAGTAFAAAVAKRSGGSIRIDVDPEIHHDRVDFEGGVVEAVRAHRSDLAVVGARVWDTLGVTSFQVLLAPFLVDNLELERRVLESPLAPRMLAGVERSGVVGVALLPGPLRMPFGFLRPLVTRDDYRGFRLGAYPGQVEAATLRSLGATIRNYLSLGGASREGAILNYGAITGGAGYHGKTFVTNVVFWPRPETVVMNREAFQSLTPAQQTILRDAGRHAVGSRLAEVRHLEQNALASICGRKLAALVTAPAGEVAALDAAVQPVYAKLELSAQAREQLAEIRALRTAGATGNDEPRSCPRRASAGASKLEGTWTSSATETALLASGATRAQAATYAGSSELELNAGRWVLRSDHTTVTGTYVVEDDVLRLTMHTCTANPCSPGAISEYDWSVYHDTLSLVPHPGAWPWLVASPGRRLR